MDTKVTKFSCKKLSYPSELKYKFVPEEIIIELNNSSCALANLIRIAPSFFPVKYLDLQLHHIDFNGYIIPDLQREFINYIPINQDIPLDTKFYIDFKNDSDKPVYMKANLIKSKTNLPICNESFYISTTSIKKDEHFKISNISVTQNDSYELDIKPMIIQSFKYTILDYFRTSCYNRRTIEYFHVHEDDIPESLKKDPIIKYNVNITLLKTLFYSDPNDKENMKHFEKNAPVSQINNCSEYYDHILPLGNIKKYYSYNSYPRKFRIEFITYGTTSGINIMKNSLTKIRDIISNNKYKLVDNGFQVKIKYQIAYMMLDLLKIKFTDNTFLIHQNEQYKDEIVFLTDYKDKEYIINWVKENSIKLIDSLIKNFKI